MSKRPVKSHAGRKGLAVSLAPLSADKALAAALRVNPDDLKRLEAEERKVKKRK
jgi:hypothetical protein